MQHGYMRTYDFRVTGLKVVLLPCICTVVETRREQHTRQHTSNQSVDRLTRVTPTTRIWCLWSFLGVNWPADGQQLAQV